MLHLIRTEWLKVRYYRTFWAMLLLVAIIIPATNYVGAEVNKEVRQRIQSAILGSPYDFPTVWQTMANVNSYTAVLLGFPLLLLITNEFTYKTHRQNIIDGWERRQFVLAKLFWWLLLGMLALVITTVFGLIFGTMYGDHAVSFENYRYVFYYFLQVQVSLSIALLIGVLAKRAGIAMVLYLAYCMVVEQLLVLLLKKYAGRIGGLLPLQAGDELLPFPVIGRLADTTDRYGETVYLLMLLAYIVLLVGAVFRKILKSDL